MFFIDYSCQLFAKRSVKHSHFCFMPPFLFLTASRIAASRIARTALPAAIGTMGRAGAFFAAASSFGLSLSVNSARVSHSGGVVRK